MKAYSKKMKNKGFEYDLFSKYYEFNYKQCKYIIALDDTCCTLSRAKLLRGDIIMITKLIDNKFAAERIIPFNDLTRINELIIIKNNHKGIYYIDTDTIRWGYQGSVDNEFDLKNKQSLQTIIFKQLN